MGQNSNVNLLDVVDELLQLPVDQRSDRMARLGLSDWERTQVSDWLSASETSSDFLEKPPPLVREGMRLLSGRHGGLPALTESGAQGGPDLDGIKSSLPPAIPGYVIQSLVGEGGMAAVWKATQPTTGRDVAIKVMNPMLFASARARARFDREIRLTSRLVHPHIARVYEGGVSENFCYYAMELVDGQPLDQYVKSHELTQRQIIEMMRLICEAVKHAHQIGVIHCDLKPANILVDYKGEPRVLDFGLAKALEEAGPEVHITSDGSVAGTPAYMSPEQAAGRSDLGTGSDVYSLGVILYRLLTGHPPIPLTGTRMEVLQRMATWDAERPRQVCPQIDADLEALLLKALARVPEDRYATASELADDLGRYLRGEPLTARRLTLSYLLVNRSRRHRWSILIAASVAALLTLVSTVFYVRLSNEGAALRRLHEQQMAERDAAEEVSKFMLKMVALAQPEARRTGRDFNVVDWLDKSSEEMRDRLKKQPQMEIEVRIALAEAYRGFAQANEVGDNYARALDLARNLPPDRRDPDLILRLEAASAYFQDADLQAAEQILDRARARYGNVHRTTADAANAVAHQLLHKAHHSANYLEFAGRAEQVLQKELDAIRQAGAISPRIFTYRYENELAQVLIYEHKYAEAERVAREALRRSETEPSDILAPRAPLGFSLIEALNGQKKFSESLVEAQRTLDYDRAVLGPFHNHTMRTLRMRARLLGHEGRLGDADHLLATSVEQAGYVLPHDHEVTWDLELSFGRVLTAEHRPIEAARLIEDVATIRTTIGDKRTSLVRGNKCEALLLWLGATEHAPGTLAAQIYCALDKIWFDHPKEAPMLESIHRSSIGYSLYQYDGASNPQIASGTLENVVEPQLAPGAYLLALDIRPDKGPPVRQVTWLLVCPWEVRIYDEDTISPEGMPPPSGRVNQMRVSNMAFMWLFKDVPPRPDEYRLTAATGKITLPPGTYRFWGTADDGMRVWLDGAKIIDGWPKEHRPNLSADKTLDGQAHTIRLEHYQQGGESELWIRVQPLSEAAKTFAESVMRESAAKSR